MANRYWIGDSGNWNDTSNWSTTSGGSSGASVPTDADDVYFDQNSFSGTGHTVSLQSGLARYECNNLYFTDVTNTPDLYFINTLYVSGDLDIPENSITTSSNYYASGEASGGLVYAGTGANTWYLGVTCSGKFGIGGTGTVTATHDFIFEGAFVDTTNGTLDLNGYDAQFGAIILQNNAELISHASTITISNIGTHNVSQLTAIQLDDGVIDFTNTKFIFDDDGTDQRTINYADNYVKEIEIATNSGPVHLSIEDTGDIAMLVLTSGGVTINNNKRIGKLKINGNAFINIGDGLAPSIYEWERANADAGTSSVSALTTRAEIYTPAGSFTLDRVNFNDLNILGDATFYLTEDAGSSTKVNTSGHIYIGAKPTNAEQRIVMQIFDYESEDLLKTYEKEIVARPSIYQEISRPAGEIDIQLAIDTLGDDEKDYLRHNNIVKLFTYDKNEPYGILKFRGNINTYTIDYETDNINVLVRGIGARSNDYVITDGYTTIASQSDNNGTLDLFKAGTREIIIQPFTTASGTTKINSIKLYHTMIFNERSALMEISIHSTLADAQSGSSALKTLSTWQSGANYERIYTFETGVQVSASTTYYMRITQLDTNHTSNTVTRFQTKSTGGSLYEYDGASWSSTTKDLRYVVYEESDATTVSFTNTDVGAMLRTLINNHRLDGGPIDYNPLDIGYIGVSESYTFNTNTLLECIEKAHDIAGPTYYWYIDNASGNVVFKLSEDEADHELTRGHEIISISAEKPAREIYSDILFTGGDTGGGLTLYKRYTNATTLRYYGRRFYRYQDQRVTVEATADKIASNLLAKYSVPAVRAEVIVRSNQNNTDGYDINSLRLGQGVRLLGFGDVDYSLWDVAEYDESYWDYSIAELSSMVLQIAYIEDNGETAKLYLGQTPKDLVAIVSGVRRDFENNIYLENPSEPS